jgi:hypothetical protein
LELTITVKDERGKPVSGATLDIFLDTDIAVAKSQSSGKNGELRFANKTPCVGHRLKIIVRKEKFETLTHEEQPSDDKWSVDLPPLKHPRLLPIELTCAITGPVSVRANSTGLLYHCSGPSEAKHNWTISGNGAISGKTTAPSATVNAGTGGSFKLVDDVMVGGRQSQCSFQVQVTTSFPWRWILIGGVLLVIAAVSLWGVLHRPPVHPPQEIAMNINAVVLPPAVSSGEKATITISARDANGAPVTGATVEVGAGGGKFLPTADTPYDPRSRLHEPYSASGFTDGQGRFMTWWVVNPAARSYELTAKASKEGYTEAKTQFNINVQTVPTAAAIQSQGTTTLKGTFSFDFDAGLQVSAGADIFWEQKDNTLRFLVPRNGALLAHMGQPTFDAVSLETLKTQNYSAAPIDGSNNANNKLRVGTVIAVKTGTGRYAKLKINSYGFNLSISWVTYK